MLSQLPDIVFLPGQAGTDLAASALDEYYLELAASFPGGFDLAVTPAAEGMEVTPPHGDLLLAVVNDTARVLACGAVKILEPGLGEIKRMWVAPDARGMGLGRAMVGQLEDRARELGATRMRLDTSRHLPEARGLYMAVGYSEIPAYNDNPYADHWFERAL